MYCIQYNWETNLCGRHPNDYYMVELYELIESAHQGPQILHSYQWLLENKY